ncbi:MAG: prenyltransferase [Thermoplasmatota archaeon]
MDTGQVRAILGIHLGRLHPQAMPALGADPNALVESWTVAEALRQVAALKGDVALREAAEDYVALWARTFRTLVRQLRGRPERAIALFAEEFYPFLRGDRLAARVESAEPRRARLLLLADLPEAYLAGLLASFVALSGATASVRVLGAGRFEVQHRVEAFDRLVPITQQMTVLRAPLVLAAVLACLLGVAMAAQHSGAPLPAGRVAAVLVGAVAVQMGANAFHDLRHPHPAGPLRLLAPTRRRLVWQARAGYAVAGACGLYLALAAPIIWAFAGLGLVVSTLFGRLRGRGWGPLLAGLTYGPLMAGGAYHAFIPLDLAPGVLWQNMLPTAALGLSAAAMLHLDDLADRPLDEAGGQRTLAVRLPRQRQAAVFDALAVLAVVAWAFAIVPIHGPILLPFFLLAVAVPLVAVVGIAGIVHRHLDDFAGLASARVAYLALHLTLALLLITVTLAGPLGATLFFLAAVVPVLVTAALLVPTVRRRIRPIPALGAP